MNCESCSWVRQLFSIIQTKTFPFSMSQISKAQRGIWLPFLTLDHLYVQSGALLSGISGIIVLFHSAAEFGLMRGIRNHFGMDTEVIQMQLMQCNRWTSAGTYIWCHPKGNDWRKAGLDWLEGSHNSFSFPRKLSFHSWPSIFDAVSPISQLSTVSQTDVHRQSCFLCPLTWVSSCFAEVKSTSSCTCSLQILSLWLILSCMFYTVWPGARGEHCWVIPCPEAQVTWHAQSANSQFHPTAPLGWRLAPLFPTDICLKQAVLKEKLNSNMEMATGWKDLRSCFFFQQWSAEDIREGM